MYVPSKVLKLSVNYRQWNIMNGHSRWGKNNARKKWQDSQGRGYNSIIHSWSFSNSHLPTQKKKKNPRKPKIHRQLLLPEDMTSQHPGHRGRMTCDLVDRGKSQVFIVPNNLRDDTGYSQEHGFLKLSTKVHGLVSRIWEGFLGSTLVLSPKWW